MAKTLKDDTQIGDNSSTSLDSRWLDEIVGRVSTLMLDQKEIADQIKDICKEASESGVTPKELRQLGRERAAKNPEAVTAHLQRMAELRSVLGDFADTPLGAAAA